MNRLRWTLASLFALAAMVVGAYSVRTVAAEPRDSEPQRSPLRPVAADDDDDEALDSKVATFMRKKLDASGNVLEGLVTEDFDMIAKGAKTMEAMSRASDWQMIKGPIYKQFSSEFRKVCEDLEKAAKDENVDAAGLAYMRLTMGCITCHNFVRSTMMAGTDLQEFRVDRP